MTDYAATLAALSRLEAFGVRLGLENMRAACAALGDPQASLPAIHVAGTNGKGTTAECVAALAAAHGLRAGLYTSPHLVDLRERFRIDGRPAGASAVAEAWERVAPIVEERRMTYFEATTLVAFLLFARAELDLAVVEVGLGGRLDATNVVRPDIAVVTKIARDHERHLGDDPTRIAREKAGIFKPGVPAIVGDPGPPEVRTVFLDIASELGVPLVFMMDEMKFEVRSVRGGATRFDLASAGKRWDGLEIPAAGCHFAADAALALAAWQAFADGRGIEVEEARVRRALAGVRLPGRAEWHAVGNARVLLDVAHNPDAVGRLAETLATLGEAPVALVVGILADKAWEAMLDALEPVAAGARLCGLVTPPSDRLLGRRAAARGIAARPWVEWADSVADGLAAARAAVESGGARAIVVTGSFYTVGEALLALGIARKGEPYVPERRDGWTPPAGGLEDAPAEASVT